MLPIILFNFLLWTFLSCGLPDLNIPINVVIPKNLQILKNKDGSLDISFIAYNPEKGFAGYNVYIAKESKYEVLKAVSNHVKEKKVDEAIESKYIVKSDLLDYPTIQLHRIDPNFKKTPTLIRYKLNYAPNQEPIFYPFYIGVTAFSRDKNSESDPSEILYVK